MEDVEMGSYVNYVFIAALAVISVASIGLGLLRGGGTRRKKLLRSVLLLGGAALTCFGGAAILAQFGMGWRCTPFNTMLFLCAVLFVATLWRCMNVIAHLKNTHRAIQASTFVSLVLVLVITVVWTCLFFQFLSWNDRLAPHNGQMIVCANDMHGGSCSWRYYTHINNLVHGAEILNDGSWWGAPPHQIRFTGKVST